jgi:hypothetical protein
MPFFVGALWIGLDRVQLHFGATLRAAGTAVVLMITGGFVHITLSMAIGF